MSAKPATPMLDKYVELAQEHGPILTEFFDWLTDNYTLMQRSPDGLVFARLGGEAALCAFFDVDREQVSKERDSVHRWLVEALP